MPTLCFWVDWIPNKLGLWLRRYTRHDGEWTCEAGWHQASAFIGERTRKDPNKAYSVSTFKGDKRWPKTCDSCDYRFSDRRGDQRQVFTERKLIRPDTGEEWFERSLPPGALFDTYWHRDENGPRSWYSAPDGVTLSVVLPWARADHSESHGIIDAWCVDGPASSGGQITPRAWTRTGNPKEVPPTVSAQPSIAAGKPESPGHYHGFLQLQDGRTVLTDHIG